MKRNMVFLLMGILCSSAFALEQPDQRYLVFMRTQKGVLHEKIPSSFVPERLTEVANHFPEYDPGNEINIGVGYVFSYLRYDLDLVEESLRRFLKMSETANVPIWVKLDGEQWWDARPDLWNWWDPSLPGYDPENVKNVEWTYWSSDHAIKLSWRNWGRQIRVLPQPNLMSPAYRAGCHKAMERLVPIIVEWFHNLPEEKKGLFVGLNIGWESSIGTSSYYFPNGNDLLDQPEHEDPSSGGIVIDDVLSRGLQQIGYAAVSSAGLRTQGDITENDLVEVVRLHLLDLSKKSAELGVPKEKLYTHAFGNSKGEKLYDAAVNEYSNPGWSEYWNTVDIMKNKGVVRNLKRPEVTQWGSVEWLLLYPVSDGHMWYTALKRTINAPGLKMMCIYNWEMLDKPNSEVPSEVNKIIKEGLSPQDLFPAESNKKSNSLYDVKNP